MGNRANVAVLGSDIGGKGRLYLMTHWSGDQTPHDVKKALKAETLLAEGSHVAGTIFANMTDPARITATLDPTGIANDNAIIVVNTKTQRVGFAHEDEQPKTYVDWSFADYIKLPARDIDKFYKQGRTICGELGRKIIEKNRATRAAKAKTKAAA
jgi:hypothetical protein